MSNPFTIVLNNIEYPLQSNVEIKSNSDGSTIEISLRLPQNYPSSAFSQHSEEEKAYLQLSCGKQDDVTSYVFLDYIGVNSNYSEYLATDEERKAFKGLGRKMIQTAISLGIERQLLTSTQKIKTFVSGGKYAEDEMPDVNQTLTLFEKQYPTTFKKHLLNIQTNVKLGGVTEKELEEELVKVYCQIINNNQLVKYYEHYSFKQIGDTDIAVCMETTIGKMVQSFDK